MSYKPDSTTNKMYSKIMILDIDKNITKFHSYKMFESDSIFESNINFEKKQSGKFTDYNHLVIKQTKMGEMDLYHKFSFSNIFYTKEKIPKFQWKISNEIKTIQTFNCQKATLNYKGRDWEVWFTTTIPLNLGPYVFEGLPGLIILMKDTKNNFIFEFEGLKKYKTTIYEISNSILVSNKELKNLLINYYYDPFKEIKFEGNKVKFEDSQGLDSNININEMTRKRQKELKKYNNPIELSEVVHFPSK